METKDQNYLNNVIEWATLVKGQDFLLNAVSSNEGIVSMMQEYNEAYQSFAARVLDLNADHRQALSHGLMIQTYYAINQRDLTTGREDSISQWAGSIK